MTMVRKKLPPHKSFLIENYITRNQKFLGLWVVKDINS